MKVRMKIAAIGLAITALIGASADGCNSNSSPSTGKSSAAAPSNADCGYSWKPCPSSGATAPGKGADSNPSAKASFPSTGPIRFGDWMFGDCSLSLWPPYLGLTMHPSGNLVILASTACVGYQPSEINIQITLQKWWGPAGHSPTWYDTGVTLADATLPPLVILPPDNEVPLTEQHKISDAVQCTPNYNSGAAPYRLRVDIVGVSYGGALIATGGYGAAFPILHWDCA